MTAHRYHRVSPRFWLKPWDDDTRLLGLYLLTCEHRTTEGLFRLPLAYASSDLGWPAKRLTKTFADLHAESFVEYDIDAQVVWLVKALDWQRPETTKQVVGAVKRLRDLPPTPLLQKFATALALALETSGATENIRAAWVQGLSNGIGNAIPSAIGNAIANGIPVSSLVAFEYSSSNSSSLLFPGSTPKVVGEDSRRTVEGQDRSFGEAA